MENKYALITGASSGIGKDFAKILGHKGYSLILVARRKEYLEDLKKEMQLNNKNIDIQIISTDLSGINASKSLFEETQKRNLDVTILINNAGFGIHGDFFNSSIERTNEMMYLNMITLTELTYYFGKEMLKNNFGYILQVASIGAFQPSPYFSAYSATKAYVMLFSEGLDFELTGSNVSVTTLYPGATKTEFFDVAQNKINRIVEKTLMSSQSVAKIALDAMFKRKRSIVPGFINKISAFITQLSPRKVSTWSAAKLMK